MRYFEALFDIDGERELCVLAAYDLSSAANTLDRLSAHGHTFSGIINGVCADDCADTIEGYDEDSEAADNAMIYPLLVKDEYPEGVLKLVYVKEITDAQFFEVAKLSE